MSSNLGNKKMSITSNRTDFKSNFNNSRIFDNNNLSDI
jgi:hypothetical protein